MESSGNRYVVLHDNWYKQLPYQFRWRKSDQETICFNLPISPSNIQIVTHFSTNVIPTMYGTIEEHSEQRYFDISISGTTGMAPKWYKEGSVEKMKGLTKDQGKTDAYAADPETLVTPQRSFSMGRANYSLAQGTFANTGLFRKTSELLNRARNELNDISGSQTNLATKSALHPEATGYAAFHNLYLFLLRYKDEVARGKKPSQGHPLSFVNYKDNIRYDVSINNFTLSRDARNPMLYNYSITMKAYNMQSVDTIDPGLAGGADLASLGLNGIKTSAFAKVATGARRVRNAAYAAIAAVKSAGQ